MTWYSSSWGLLFYTSLYWQLHRTSSALSIQKLKRNTIVLSSFLSLIHICTFVSRNNELWFQAGGGIVARSQDEYELQEVNNKLGALKKAIDLDVYKRQFIY